MIERSRDNKEIEWIVEDFCKQYHIDNEDLKEAILEIAQYMLAEMIRTPGNTLFPSGRVCHSCRLDPQQRFTPHNRVCLQCLNCKYSDYR